MPNFVASNSSGICQTPANSTLDNIVYRKLSDMVLLNNNPRKISAKEMKRLVESIRINGFWKHRPITLSDRNGQLVIIAGNQRYKASKKLKLSTVPTILYCNISEEQEKEIILRDNVNNGEFDFDVLKTDDIWSDIDFDHIGIDLPDITDVADVCSDFNNEEIKEGGSDSEANSEKKEDFLPTDCLYESNNEYEIPNLLIDRQAGKLELPFAAWGADSRLRKDVATYHFYVEDYRFEAIWKDPLKVIKSGVKALVEPNCSLFDTTPIAYGLHQIYKKRWISRFFQECGVLVYADLNVSAKFKDYNKLGIPEGYNAFFTRGYADRLEYLKLELETAREISGAQTPNLLVYGGGEKVRKFCIENSLVYVEQFMQNKK